MSARYRIHFLDGSSVDLDAPTAADARARFDNRGIARVKVIRGEATPAEIEARHRALSRRHQFVAVILLAATALPSIVHIIGA